MEYLISTFPPDMITATFLFKNFSLFLSIAANTVALDGSTIIFIIDHSRLTASAISSSSTNKISVTCSLIISKVLSPKLTVNPSAIVFGGNYG